MSAALRLVTEHHHTPETASVPSSPGTAPYVAPPRVPDELLESSLSDRNVRVWLAVRKVQGSNPSAWARTEHYAEVAGKSLGATKNALSELTAGGWIEEVGKRGRTPVRRCAVPRETSRTVTNNVTHRDESPGRNVTDGDPYSSRTVTNNVTHRDHCPYMGFESGQGIRSGNPDTEQQQHARGVGGQKKSGPQTDRGPEVHPLTTEQARRRDGFLALDVYDRPAERLARTLAPEWADRVLAAGRQLQSRGKTVALGALVVLMADGAEPLPAPARDHTPEPAARPDHVRFSRAVEALPAELRERFDDLRLIGPAAWERDAELSSALHDLIES